jgi:hypothetical protein
VNLARFVQELDAGHRGHALIDQEQRHQVAALPQLADRVERLGPRCGGHDPVVAAKPAAQIQRDRVQHLRLVVDGEDDGLRPPPPRTFATRPVSVTRGSHAAMIGYRAARPMVNEAE